MARDLILSIFPELTAVGGIQQMSRHVGATLEEFAASKGLRCELIGLNDPSGEGVFEVAGREYRFRGFARNKAALLAHLTGRARQTQLVLTSHVNLGPLALWMKMLQGRARYWVMVHGMEVWEPLPLARRTALRKADGIIAVSRHTAETTVKVQRVARGKIVVLSPALDPRHSAPDGEQPQWPVPQGSRVLLTVARLLASEPGKGVDTVIRALPRLLKSFANLYYVVIGDGDDRPPLENLAVKCGVAERVHPLQYEPEPEHEPGRDADRDEEQERDQAPHPGPRVEHQVRAEHPGDRPGRTDQRPGRSGVRDSEAIRRDVPARQVEEQVGHPAETVLDVVAEDEQEEHVAEQVQPPRVHEHGCQDRDRRVLLEGPAGHHAGRPLRGRRHLTGGHRLEKLPAGDQLARDRPVVVVEGLLLAQRGGS